MTNALPRFFTRLSASVKKAHAARSREPIPHNIALAAIGVTAPEFI